MPYFNNRRGDRLWFEESGEGEALLLVHGWCMSSAVWSFQLKGLRDSFRVVAPDLRGHGSSRGVTERFDFDTFSSDISDLLSFLNLERVILVGWSMGAQIALKAFAEISDRLSGVVLVSATPCFTARPDFPFGLPPAETAGMRLKVSRNPRRAVDGFLTRMFTEVELADRQVADNLRTLLSSITPPDTDATLAALESLSMADMRDLLPTITAPVLVINGDGDKICLPQASGYLAENIPGASQILFSDTGHAPFMTRYEGFNAEILRFSRRVHINV